MNGQRFNSEIIAGPDDFYFEVSKGNIPGTTVGTIFGHNGDLDPSSPETIWDYGGLYTYLTADTELFMSSSSASDVNVVIVIQGMTDDYVAKTLVHTFTGGQTQESIGLWFRVFKTIVVAGSAPLGNIYTAESDTLTAGVPDTPSKVKDYMDLGSNTSHKAAYTVPAGHTLYATRIYMATRRGEDCVFNFLSKTAAYPAFVSWTDYPVYQNGIFHTYSHPFPVAEKTDIEFRGTTVTNNTQGSVNIGYILVDDSVA